VSWVVPLITTVAGKIFYWTFCCQFCSFYYSWSLGSTIAHDFLVILVQWANTRNHFLLPFTYPTDNDSLLAFYLVHYLILDSIRRRFAAKREPNKWVIIKYFSVILYPQPYMNHNWVNIWPEPNGIISHLIGGIGDQQLLWNSSMLIITFYAHGILNSKQWPRYIE